MENTQKVKLPGIHKMEKRELIQVNGGNAFFIAIGVAAFVEIIADWDNFKNGLTGKKEIPR